MSETEISTEPCIHWQNCHMHRKGFDPRGSIIAEAAIRMYEDQSVEFIRKGQVYKITWQDIEVAIRLAAA
ncbi:hypothetical protein JFK97_06015 [Chromobacterium phragmitis]|uniref:hypothetical protein n=1 Tax=Chromobacterium amazonense TaxID=1382803 RepID=UPI0021B754C3|nr:hypothetical protein [Chromobacterium amazonense]MBM2883941.1 hypothetical protein [Chromobacterium amazonense]MDE1711858.1 hypothetical protein [Chromobacterium amazonense]